MDDGRLTACCQLADAETVETEAEAFDCETCQVRQQLDALDADNRQAWEWYQHMSTRFVIERGLVPQLVARATAGLDDADAADLLTRLAIVHDLVVPMRPTDGA